MLPSATCMLFLAVLLSTAAQAQTTSVAPAPGSATAPAFDVEADASATQDHPELPPDAPQSNAAPDTPEVAEGVKPEPDAGLDAAGDAFADSDDGLGDDELDAMGGPPKLPAGFTGVWGRVADASTGETLIEATVQVVKGGTTKRVLTDLDGWFSLALSPGTYDVRVFYELYQGRRISNLQVEAGKPLRLDVALSGDEGAVQEVVVETTVDRRREAAILQERKGSAVVSDALSAQEISRTPDSSASDAAKRVVSLTVEDGKYVYVRGLGGRYAMTLLNGVGLPSPEPDRDEVPLDLFPTSLLSSLTVFKTYDAQLPGTFGGGALQIGTSDAPRELEVNLKVGASGDSQTTFQQGLGYQGGAFDFLGWDDGTRALPDAVPGDVAVDLDSRKGITRERNAEIGRSFNNIWELQRHHALPNLTLGGTVANTLRLGTRKLGFLASLNYAKKESIQRTTIAKVFDPDGAGPGGHEYREELSNELGVSTANVGGLLNVDFEAANGHTLGLTSLYTHSGEATAQHTTGFSVNDGQAIDSTRLQFITREMSFTQLHGRHRLSSNGGELTWQGNLSLTSRGEPDTRDLVYFPQADGRMGFKNSAGSGERFFSGLSDLGTGLGANLSLPFKHLTLRSGASAQLQSRTFDARRIGFTYVGSSSDSLFLPPEELFAPENFGSVIRVSERTLASDSYVASRLVSSAYAAAELRALSDRLRIIGGARFELSNQHLSSQSPFSNQTVAGGDVERSDPAFIPSVNAVYALSETVNLRAAYGFTVARPSFRELAPFSYYDFSRRRTVTGNPNLVESRIHHGDVRLEWFFGATELLALTGFAKEFINPIEQVVSNDMSDVYFANADGATAVGAELEARVGLGRISPWLSDFKLGGNATLMHSRVQFSEDTVTLQTNRERPLQGMSPYVLNANLSWVPQHWGTSVTLSYNIHGPRISDVGFQFLPDTYEQPFRKLDLSATQELGAGLRLKASVTNLLDQKLELLQGALKVFEYRPGVAGSLQLEWNI